MPSLKDYLSKIPRNAPTAGHQYTTAFAKFRFKGTPELAKYEKSISDYRTTVDTALHSITPSAISAASYATIPKTSTAFTGQMSSSYGIASQERALSAYRASRQAQTDKLRAGGVVNWRMQPSANMLTPQEAFPIIAKGAVAGAIGIGKSLMGVLQTIADVTKEGVDAPSRYKLFRGVDQEKQELADTSNVEQMQALSSWTERRADATQYYIDKNWGASETWNEAQRFMYDLGAAIPSIGASLMMTGLLHSSKAAGILFGLIQQGSKYQQYRKDGMSVNKSLLLSGTAGVIEGTLERAFLDKWMTMPNATVARRLVLRPINEGLQELSQSLGGSAMDFVAYKNLNMENLKKAAVQALYEGLIGMIVGVPAAVTQSISEKNGYTYIKKVLTDGGIPANVATEAATHIQNKLIAEAERLNEMSPEERVAEQENVVNKEIQGQAEKRFPVEYGEAMAVPVAAKIREAVVNKKIVVEKDRVAIFHISPNANLQNIDPEMMGKGRIGAERGQIAPNGEMISPFLKKANYYGLESPVEAAFYRGYVYYAQVPMSQLVLAEVGEAVDEKQAMAEGKIGIIYRNPTSNRWGDGEVRLFVPVEAINLGQGAMPDDAGAWKNPQFRQRDYTIRKMLGRLGYAVEDVVGKSAVPVPPAVKQIAARKSQNVVQPKRTVEEVLEILDGVSKEEIAGAPELSTDDMAKMMFNLNVDGDFTPARDDSGDAMYESGLQNPDDIRAIAEAKAADGRFNHLDFAAMLRDLEALKKSVNVAEIQERIGGLREDAEKLARAHAKYNGWVDNDIAAVKKAFYVVWPDENPSKVNVHGRPETPGKGDVSIDVGAIFPRYKQPDGAIYHFDKNGYRVYDRTSDVHFKNGLIDFGWSVGDVVLVREDKDDFGVGMKAMYIPLNIAGAGEDYVVVVAEILGPNELYYGYAPKEKIVNNRYPDVEVAENGGRFIRAMKQGEQKVVVPQAKKAGPRPWDAKGNPKGVGYPIEKPMGKYQPYNVSFGQYVNLWAEIPEGLPSVPRDGYYHALLLDNGKVVVDDGGIIPRKKGKRVAYYQAAYYIQMAVDNKIPFGRIVYAGVLDNGYFRKFDAMDGIGIVGRKAAMLRYIHLQNLWLNRKGVKERRVLNPDAYRGRRAIAELVGAELGGGNTETLVKEFYGPGSVPKAAPWRNLWEDKVTPENLAPAKERAQKVIKIPGGEKKLEASGDKVDANGDYRAEAFFNFSVEDDGSPLTDILDRRFLIQGRPEEMGRDNIETPVDGIPAFMRPFRDYIRVYATPDKFKQVVIQKAKAPAEPYKIFQMARHGDWVRGILLDDGSEYLGGYAQFDDGNDMYIANHANIIGHFRIPLVHVVAGSHVLGDSQRLDKEWLKHFVTGAHFDGMRGKLREAFRYVAQVEHAVALIAKHPEFKIQIPQEVLDDVKLLKARLKEGKWIIPNIMGPAYDVNEKRYNDFRFKELHYNGAPIDEAAREWVEQEETVGEFDDSLEINRWIIPFYELWGPGINEWTGLSDMKVTAPTQFKEKLSTEAAAMKKKEEAVLARYDSYHEFLNKIQEENSGVYFQVWGKEMELRKDAEAQGVDPFVLFEQSLYPMVDAIQRFKNPEMGIAAWTARARVNARKVNQKQDYDPEMFASATREAEVGGQRIQELPTQPALEGGLDEIEALLGAAEKGYVTNPKLLSALINNGVTLTAFSPHLTVDKDLLGLDDAARNDRMLQELKERGYTPILATGKYEGEGSETPSFFVQNMTMEDAEYFRKRYGQESVLIGGGLLYADNKVRPVLYKDGKPLIEIIPEGVDAFNALVDGYTILEWEGKNYKFVYSLDWGDNVFVDAQKAQAQVVERGATGRPGFILMQLLGAGPHPFWSGRFENWAVETTGMHKREALLDDVAVVRDMMTPYLGNENIINMRLAAVLAVNWANDGQAPLPNALGQITAPGVKLLPFYVIGEKLAAGGKKFADLNLFARIYVASLGYPVNQASEPDINLVVQKDMGKVIENANKMLAKYSAEDAALYKEIMGDVRAYITPMVTRMVAIGMIDTEGLSVEAFIDRYMSGAPIDMVIDFSTPFKARHMESVSKVRVIDFMEGIFNSMYHLYQGLYYNEFLKQFAEIYGLSTDRETALSYWDNGKKVYVAAPEHIARQLRAILDRHGPTEKLLSSGWYTKAMRASRQLKIFTPAFAMMNLPRDAMLVFSRYGIHPGSIVQAIVNVFAGKSKKASGLAFMELGQVEAAVPKTLVYRIAEYIRDNVIGVSESLMRNYAAIVERKLGGTEAAQSAALLSGSTDFTVHGSSGKLMNVWAVLQFAKASLNVSQSWNQSIRNLFSELKSPDRGRRLNAIQRMLYLFAILIGGIVLKTREKQKKILQDYVMASKIPVPLGKKILLIPEGWNTGAMLTNSISAVVAGMIRGDPYWKIQRDLGEEVFAGIMGYIGRDGDVGIRSILSTMTPTLIEPLFRAFVTNVQFGGRLIDAFEYGKKYTHYYDSTSEVAKKFAARLHAKDPNIDISPIALEFVLKTYLGRYGTALTMTDDAVEPGIFNGLKNAAAYIAKQPYFVAIPEGIQTQMYQDFKEDYKKLEGDVANVRSGKLNVSPDMAFDLQQLDAVHAALDKLIPYGFSADIFALATYGESIYESYVKHAKQYKGN